MSSHARQPLHLSASIVMPLTVFLTLPIADNPSLLQVFANVVQVQIVQGRLRGNTLVIPPLELVVLIQELRFHLGESLLPMVLRRLLVRAPHAPSHIDGSEQRPVPRGYLPQAGFVDVDPGRRRDEGRV